jgi:nucleotide-binding universal stress UspA family protein
MLPRFRHILVPLDFTEKNQSALDVAFEMAVANQSRVTLLHVIEQIDLPGDDEVDEFTDQLRQRADRELELRGQRFAEANVSIDWKIRLGERAREIAGYESEHAIDLIVLSSHPVDATDPARSLATLSYQVAVLSRCPVLLVK